uniref:Delta-like 2 homolog (Drosophila) n=1 Tax=Oryzias melastigma TaxID=30732 RepID=A0A3B3DXS0_ORYME
MSHWAEAPGKTQDTCVEAALTIQSSPPVTFIVPLCFFLHFPAVLSRCDPGWGGEHCDRCVLMPGCVHGSCQQPWQCTCEPGWGGRVCSSQQPCQNGATCTMKDNGDFTCLCPQGFHGRLCQRRSGPCHQSRSPCKNGGLCEDADGFAAELSCRCLAGFTGPRCETDIDDCRMKPCANDAVCLDGINRFSCVCPGGFTGRFCTVNLDDCASRPCLNGGRCLDLAGGFRCICQLGFMGNTCDTSLSSNWTTRGEKGKGKRSSNMTHHGNRLMKVTVSDRGGAGLSDVQLIVVVVLGAVTLAVVATPVPELTGWSGWFPPGPAPPGFYWTPRRPPASQQSDHLAAEPEPEVWG